MTGRNIELKLEEALRRGPVLIYGAHLVALELYRYLKFLFNGLEFAGFVVTSAEGNPEELEQEKVIEIQDCQASKDATVMIAMPEKYHDEAEAYARGLGFSNFIRISLEKMSELKGRQILRSYTADQNSKLCLYEDDHDVSWLNMAQHSENSFGESGQARRHYKFPTLYYLDLESVFRKAERFEFYEDYERILGIYRNLHGLPVKPVSDIDSKDSGKQQLHIYMVFSKWDSAAIARTEYPKWICPIQAGSVFTEKKPGPFLDETGDNISEKNRMLAEMTAAYWIWKNAAPVKYKGLCHYRRHFVITEEEVMALEENGIDAILTTPRYVPGGIRNMFLEETPVKEAVYRAMLEAVWECHPESRESFERYLEECLYYPNNMVIARSEIYDAYCEWVFPVLFQMLEIDQETGYGQETDRHVAYAAELLTSYYFAMHKDEYCVVVTDYKFYL